MDKNRTADAMVSQSLHHFIQQHLNTEFNLQYRIFIKKNKQMLLAEFAWHSLVKKQEPTYKDMAFVETSEAELFPSNNK